MTKLQRYVSKELTHFVGRSLSEDEERYNLLLKILRHPLLYTPNEYFAGMFQDLDINILADLSSNKMFNPDMVCFCDIPIEDLEIHMNKYSRFGLSFLKSFLIQKGASPLFYIEENSIIKFGDTRAQHFNQIGEICKYYLAWIKDPNNIAQIPSDDLERLLKIKDFLLYQFFSFLKFFDSAKEDDDPDNFYMEREWRVLGEMQFELSNVRRVIIPETYAKRFRDDLPEYYGQITFVD
jgi:hypothetical protein